jgi:hypothetical protein
LRLSLPARGFPFGPLAVLGASEEGAWVEELMVCGPDDEQTGRWLDCPLLAHLHTLALLGLPLTPETLRALVGSPHLERLRSLDLSTSEVGPEAAAALRARFGSRVRLPEQAEDGGHPDTLLRLRIEQVLRMLTGPERTSICLRFALRCGCPFRVTRERIRAIEARGVLRRRRPSAP